MLFAGCTSPPHRSRSGGGPTPASRQKSTRSDVSILRGPRPRSGWTPSSARRSPARSSSRSAAASARAARSKRPSSYLLLDGQVLPVAADVEEDEEAGDGRDDECRRLRDADREHPEEHVEGEHERPEERGDAGSEGRESQVHGDDPNGTKNSPSRWRFRPPNRLTFRSGLAASTYCLPVRLRPTCAPCSVHTGSYGFAERRSRDRKRKTRNLRKIV